tara:strand:+ start:10477 stop:10731 length:255 start_codon:yes stop_codon:yes gene_type:complete
MLITSIVSIAFMLSTRGVVQERTISKDKFSNTSDIHRNAAEEVVITTQSNETGWCDGALESTQNENGGRVWDQETNQAEKGWVG